MNTIKVSVLLIVILFVVAGCNYTSKPRTVDSEQARLYPRVPYEAIKDNYYCPLKFSALYTN